MNLKNAYKALDLISEKDKLNLNDIDILLNLSIHKNSEIRSYCAQLMAMLNNIEFEKALINMLIDNDELVRVNACDSLSEFPSTNTYNSLLNCALNDESSLVKSYAILSIGDIISNTEIDKNNLKNNILNIIKSKDSFVLYSCFRVLYIIGEKQYLSNILSLLNTDNYQIKCFVINGLTDILNQDNKKIIISALENIRKTETSIAVTEAIDNLINNNEIQK